MVTFLLNFMVTKSLGLNNILKSIESYKLCGNILFVGGNPPKKAVFPTIKRELKKERVFLFGMLSLIYLMNK